MKNLSTREAARKLGITHASLSRYMAAKKIPTPKEAVYGRFRVHLWTQTDIERVRKLLPKIANGRKTRYQKKNSAVSTQQSAKAKTQKQPQAKRPVSHKQRRKK
jgi:Helix-turn-helix